MFFGIIKKPLHPCKEDNICLVRASCKLPVDSPWDRRHVCSIYTEYEEKREKYNDLENKKDDFLFYIICGILICLALSLVGIFGVGLVTTFKWIWPWLF